MTTRPVPELRTTARRTLGAIAAALLTAGCGLLLPSAEAQLTPLSRVTVSNETDELRLARMNWPDGFIQVSAVPAGKTHYLMGAIGTNGFPASIDILDADCRVLHRVQGLTPGSYGFVTVTVAGASIRSIQTGERSWRVAEQRDECGAT